MTAKTDTLAALPGMALPADAPEWLPALVAFYRADGCPMRAEGLARGGPMDGTDIQTLEALKAAFQVAP